MDDTRLSEEYERSTSTFARGRVMKPIIILLIVLAGLYWTTWQIYPPVFDTAGDAPGYLETMQVMTGGAEPSERFTPNRILTTFPSTGTVALIGSLTGDYLASWLVVNALYFFGLGLVSFLLFRRFTGSAAGSVIGALFVAGNYDMLVFGLTYLMDSTGWFWFMLSALFLFVHMERESVARQAGTDGAGEHAGTRYLWLAVLAAGIGGLFKEYAYFGVVPVAAYLLWRYAKAPVTLFARGIPLAVASVVSTLIVHAAVYLIYGYSYLDWYGMNTSTFGWDGWLIDFTRSILVVLSVLLPVAILGLVAFVREMRRNPDPARIVFMIGLALPAISALVWPIVTERLVFLVVPVAALLAAYAVKRYEREWPLFALIWASYAVLALKTDGLILNYLYAL